MDKRFFIGWLVVFIAWFMGSYIVHGTLLGDDYRQLPNLFRPEDDASKYFPLMILAHVIMAGAFTWIYARGNEPKPWLAQGVRYGIAVALLTVVPWYAIYYVVQPMPGAMVAKQIIFSTILVVVLGVIVAWLYRDRAVSAA